MGGRDKRTMDAIRICNEMLCMFVDRKAEIKQPVVTSSALSQREITYLHNLIFLMVENTFKSDIYF